MQYRSIATIFLSFFAVFPAFSMDGIDVFASKMTQNSLEYYSQPESVSADYGSFRIIMNTTISTNEDSRCTRKQQLVMATVFINMGNLPVTVKLAAKTLRHKKDEFSVIDVIVPSGYEIQFPSCDFDNTSSKYPFAVEAIFLNVDEMFAADVREVRVVPGMIHVKGVYESIYGLTPDIYRRGIYEISRLQKVAAQALKMEATISVQKSTIGEFQQKIRALQNQTESSLNEIRELRRQLENARRSAAMQTTNRQTSSPTGRSPSAPPLRMGPSPDRRAGHTYVCSCKILSRNAACNVEVSPSMSYPRGRSMCSGAEICDYSCTP